MTEGRPLIKAETMEGIGLVTFNAPIHNVASVEMWDAFVKAINAYATDHSVRVIVLTGAGHHAFVSDPDAAEIEEQTAYDAAAQRAQNALVAFAKPVIARLRGDCFGAGLALALHADLLIAAKDSAFSLPGARWGAAYAPDAVAALSQLVGPQHAKRMLLVGGRINAREALRIGLVTMVVDDEDLSDTVVDLARAIAENAPLAVAAGKRMVDLPKDPALADLTVACRASQDYATGLAAFRRGKLPIFQGT
jgi:enoyl-CoA hydratase/carnithine racemase